MYRILLLDDDPDDLELMQELLCRQSRIHFHVVPVHTIEEAEWHVRHNSFDLLVVDYHLGGEYGERQGTDFIKYCRSRGLRTPALLVSGQPRVLLDQEILSLISSGDLKFLNKQDIDAGNLLDGVFSLICRPIRVMIVDDCQQQAKELQDMLHGDEFHRFHVQVEHALPAALAHARANNVDVVVVKHALPPCTGIDLVRQIIAGGHGQNTSFVLLAEPRLLTDDYTALCLVGRRRITLLSADSVDDGSIVPTIVRARNDSLAENYYGSRWPADTPRAVALGD